MGHVNIAVDPEEQFFQCMEHFVSTRHMLSVVFSALIHPCFSTAPDGVMPPRLSSATPTSLQVVWSTPARNNAPGAPSYRLQMRRSHSAGDILEYAERRHQWLSKKSPVVLNMAHL